MMPEPLFTMITWREDRLRFTETLVFPDSELASTW
jgi:hypothetical protein